MADIQLVWRHPYDRVEAKKRIEPAVSRTAKSFGLRFQWNGDICNFKGPARGFIAVKNDTVEMAADLGFVARLLKSTIENRIRKEFAQALG